MAATIRPAAPPDAFETARIYNEGIAGRQATFETRPRSAHEVVAAEQAGYHKLTAKLFTSNAASLALARRCGFAEVGVHRRHAQLDGDWRDVLVVELLLGDVRRFRMDFRPG